MGFVIPPSRSSLSPLTLSHPEIRYSNSRSRPYFYSITAKESRWDPPSSFTPEELLALPGAEHLSAAPSSGPPKQVRASHLLIKHAGSRRPGSWKEKVITRSKEEAIEILKAHQKTLNDADDLVETFARIAKTESDCTSARQGGDLGAWPFLRS